MLTKATWLLSLLGSTALAAHWKERLRDIDVESIKPRIEAAKAAQALGKRQDASANETFTQWAPPPYAVVQQTPKYWSSLGSKRVQVKYGPFNVPPMNQGNGMADYLQIGTYMPCSDCTITYMHAGLELPDGSNANAFNNQWLHHVLLIDIETPDTVCGSNYYAHGQRFFASGNERVPVDITQGKVQSGYFVEPFSTQVMMAELMNAGMEQSTVVVTIEYEYIEGSLPANWYNTRPIWLDIAGCDIESDMPPKTNTTFNYVMSPQYTSQYNGVVIGQGGHVHDGGVNLFTFKNGQKTCNQVAKYTGKPAYLSPKGGMMTGPGPAPAGSLTWSMPNMPGMAMMMREHVNAVTTCYVPQHVEALVTGDKIWNQAFYNFNTHAPMLNWDTSIADIMGISLVYMAQDMTTAQMASYFK